MSSSWVKANDVLEELSDENKRLLNELMFANKCLKVLIEFKVNFDLHSNKIKTVFVSDEWQKFEEVNKRINEAFCNYQGLSELSRLNRNANVETQSNRSNDSLVCDDIGVDDVGFDVNEDIKPIVIPTKKSSTKSADGGQPVTIDGQPRIIKRRKRKKQPLDCTWPGCDYKASVPHRLTTHLNEHKGIRPFVCEFDNCGKAFTSHHYLRDHMRLHTNREQTFKHFCEFEGCGKKFRRRYEYVDHKNKHLGIFDFVCTECPDKRFSSKTRLQNHIEMVHKLLDQPLVCTIDDCNREFKTAMSFKVHQNVQHLKGKRFHCDQPNCNYNTPLKTSLSRHQRSVHTKERPFVCQVPGCFKNFTEKKDVADHVKRCHIAERNFHCTEEGCQKAYKTRTELTKHVQATHTGIRYACDWPGCDHKSTTTQSLKIHKIMVHLGQRNYKCQWPDCGKAFKSNSSLRDHIRMHNNDKRYACTWPGCCYRCTNSSNLTKHLRVHNNTFRF